MKQEVMIQVLIDKRFHGIPDIGKITHHTL
jgi:hypothetical protein